MLSHPEVNAVIVSSSEGEHTGPVIAALKRGMPVLVEKPIALTVPESDLMLRTVRELSGDLRVGYSRRYKTRYLLAKEQLLQGRLGTITGACARLYNSRAQCLAMLGRNRHATPVVDALTYYVDLMGWLLAGNPVVEVFARGQKGVIQRAGYAVDDVTWAVLTCRDGAVVNLGVSYALPENWPSVGQPDMREKFLAQGFEPARGSPVEFAAFIGGEIVKWAQVVRAAGIAAE